MSSTTRQRSVRRCGLSSAPLTGACGQVPLFRPEPARCSRYRSDAPVWTGPCRALGADTPRYAELRGDLACRRLGSEGKDVKSIYARDSGKVGRKFAR